MVGYGKVNSAFYTRKQRSRGPDRFGGISIGRWRLSLKSSSLFEL